MPDALTPDQILALAPDPASAKSGRGLAAPQHWVSAGSSERALWGECRGSAKDPYRTQIDLSELAYRCSCPSRKFPCKHALGLMLLRAAQPAAVPSTDPPSWVAEWLESRAKSAEKKAEKAAERQSEQSDPAAQAKSAAAQARSATAREAKVAAGIDELGRWLRDLVRQGIASAASQPVAYWYATAARLVDAQAPGAARMVRQIPSICGSGPGWQARLLEHLARLHLLAEGYRRRDALAPEELADVRTALGFSVSQDELLAGAGLRDEWLVLGQRVEEEDQLRVQRTWLWGRASARPALALSFAAAGQPLDRSLASGTAIDAELVFFPGAAPLRALVRERHGAARPLTSAPAMTLSDATAGYAAALARNPWIGRWPVCIAGATLAFEEARWLVRDQEGRQLPVAGAFPSAWRLLAVSGGQPVALTAEWDGDQLTPLGAMAGPRWLILSGPQEDA